MSAGSKHTADTPIDALPISILNKRPRLDEHRAREERYATAVARLFEEPPPFQTGTERLKWATEHGDMEMITEVRRCSRAFQQSLFTEGNGVLQPLKDRPSWIDCSTIYIDTPPDRTILTELLCVGCIDAAYSQRCVQFLAASGLFTDDRLRVPTVFRHLGSVPINFTCLDPNYRCLLWVDILKHYATKPNNSAFIDALLCAWGHNSLVFNLIEQCMRTPALWLFKHPAFIPQLFVKKQNWDDGALWMHDPVGTVVDAGVTEAERKTDRSHLLDDVSDAIEAAHHYELRVHQVLITFVTDVLRLNTSLPMTTASAIGSPSPSITTASAHPGCLIWSYLSYTTLIQRCPLSAECRLAAKDRCTWWWLRNDPTPTAPTGLDDEFAAEHKLCVYCPQRPLL